MPLMQALPTRAPASSSPDAAERTLAHGLLNAVSPVDDNLMQAYISQLGPLQRDRLVFSEMAARGDADPPIAPSLAAALILAFLDRHAAGAAAAGNATAEEQQQLRELGLRALSRIPAEHWGAAAAEAVEAIARTAVRACTAPQQQPTTAPPAPVTAAATLLFRSFLAAGHFPASALDEPGGGLLLAAAALKQAFADDGGGHLPDAAGVRLVTSLQALFIKVAAPVAQAAGAQRTQQRGGGGGGAAAAAESAACSSSLAWDGLRAICSRVRRESALAQAPVGAVKAAAEAAYRFAAEKQRLPAGRAAWWKGGGAAAATGDAAGRELFKDLLLAIISAGQMEAVAGGVLAGERRRADPGASVPPASHRARHGGCARRRQVGA